MLITKTIGPKQTFSVTSAPFAYVDIDDVQIPLSDTTKYGRTLVAGDFPVYSSQPASVTHIEICCVSGYNNSGGSVTISYQMYINDGAVSGGTGSLSIDNAKFFHVNCHFYGVVAGDKCEVSVWGSSNTNVDVRSYMSHCVPTRIAPTIKNVRDVTETYYAENPTTGAALAYNSRGYVGETAEYAIAATTAVPLVWSSPVRSFVSANGYNIFRYGKGDYQTLDGGTITPHSSNAMYFSIAPIPTSISYREINEGRI